MYGETRHFLGLAYVFGESDLVAWISYDQVFTSLYLYKFCICV